jgi:hypothetical protein
MNLRERYGLALPFYRPESVEQHYQNNLYIENAFNALPIPRTYVGQQEFNFYGITFDTEIIRVQVRAERNEQFLVSATGLFGSSANTTAQTPGTVGNRVQVHVSAYYDGNPVNPFVARIGDFICPVAASSITKFNDTFYWKSPITGMVDFALSCRVISGGGYGWVAAAPTVPTQLIVRALGVE